jgi:phosphoribosyl-AMP cyclohydrolase
MPVAQSIALAPAELDSVRFNEHGLVAAIVQDEANGQVLMMAWMNAETLAQSLSEGRTVFWSRSRSEVWRKGDTSGDRQFIRSAHYDCDGDTLLFVVEQEGKGACHTGERTCFYRAFGAVAGAITDTGGGTAGEGTTSGGTPISFAPTAPSWWQENSAKRRADGQSVESNGAKP